MLLYTDFTQHLDNILYYNLVVIYVGYLTTFV